MSSSEGQNSMLHRAPLRTELRRAQSCGRMRRPHACRADGRHQVGYELSWLQLSDPCKVASPQVLSHFADHVRSAAHYSFCHDARQRSEHGLLHSGHAVHLQMAVAGLSPDSSRLQHVRAQADVQHVLPLSEGGALVIDSSLGMHPASSGAPWWMLLAGWRGARGRSVDCVRAVAG
jgi:hypothetical protein